MKSKLILILDDSEIVANLTSFLVENLGHKTILFTKGSDALEYLTSTEEPYPDLIIADHYLGTVGEIRKTGFKVLKKLKGFGVTIPVILASGVNNKSIINKYKKLGVTEFVNKDSVSYVEDLVTIVDSVLNEVKV